MTYGSGSQTERFESLLSCKHNTQTAPCPSGLIPYCRPKKMKRRRLLKKERRKNLTRKMFKKQSVHMYILLTQAKTVTC
jgi:hypothetical protein